MKTSEARSTSPENPLVPHQLLRQMYTAMLGVRLLDAHVQKSQRKSRGKRMLSASGMEAPLAAVLLGLRPGDFVLDATDTLAVDQLLGTSLPTLLHSAREANSSLHPSGPPSPFAHDDAATRLPFVADGERRIAQALGAAASAKAAARHQATVVFTRHRELKPKVWRWALGYAAQHELPIVFVVLPEENTAESRGAADVRELARKSRVPGIPVESTDSIALYRVAQESLGRLRGGDGPALIECIPYRLPATTAQPDDNDALIKLKKYLLDHGVSNAAWAMRIEKDFIARLVRAERREASRR